MHSIDRTKLRKDIKSIDHDSCHSDNLVEDSVRIEDINVPSIIDDNEASVYKADRSSVSDHHDTTSRRLVVTVRIQTVMPSETGDVTSSKQCKLICTHILYVFHSISYTLVTYLYHIVLIFEAENF